MPFKRNTEVKTALQQAVPMTEISLVTESTRPVEQSSMPLRTGKSNLALFAGVNNQPGMETLQQPIAGREAEMHRNAAGSFVFTLNNWGVLERFLIAGSEQGTFYAGEQELTQDNTSNLAICIVENATRVNNLIRTMDEGGRLFRKKYAIYALAMLSCPRWNGVSGIPMSELYWGLLRTGSDLLMYVSIVRTMRGWGDALKRAVGEFYRVSTQEELNDVAYQVTKYRNRYGWTHADVMRCLHLRPRNAKEEALFSYIRDENRWARPDVDYPEAIRNKKAIDMFMRNEVSETARRAAIAEVIRQKRLGREFVPTEYHNDPMFLFTMATVMPATALMRNLRNIGRMMSENKARMMDYPRAMLQLQECIAEKVKQVHPYQTMQAMMALINSDFSSDVEGWVDVLENALREVGSKAIPETGEHLIAIDISGSMESQTSASGLTALTEATMVAYAMAIGKPNATVILFSRNGILVPLENRSLREFRLFVAQQTHGMTYMDMAIQFMDGMEKTFDSITILTDNEVNGSRNQHASTLLKVYRRERQVNTRMAIVAFTATEASVADPKDAYMADFVGFDSSSMDILGDFLSR